MSGARTLRVALLAALAASTAALFVRVLLAGDAQPGVCGATPPAHGPISEVTLAAVAAASFVVGGFFGGWRARAAATTSLPRPGDIAIHVLLVVVLAGTAVALGYETYALAHPTSAWPITFYVRCANVVAPGWSLLGLAATSGLLGHWLWRP